MFYRILSLMLSFFMTVLAPFSISCDNMEEKLQMSASIIGEFSYGDENPEIGIEVSKTSFCLHVSNDNVFLDGAFRDLEIESVKRNSARSILIRTQGKISSVLSSGYVILAEDATYAKTAIQAETAIDMSKIDPGITGGIDIDGEEIAKKAAKSLITMGIKKIPYVGGFAAGALDSTINSIIGINAEPSISDVINELHAISAQLDELTNLVSASSQEILKSLYEEKNFSAFNTEVNSLKNSVNAMLNQLAVIEGSTGSESYKYLMTAELLDFDEKNISSMVRQTRDLANYLDGTQVSARPQKGIFEKAYDYVCTDAIFGGEAAAIVAPYVNEISGVFSYSYKVMAIVLNAKLWVHDNYDSIIADAETDPSLKKELSTLENGNYDNAYYFGLWTDLLSETSETSIARIHNKHFSDEAPESTAEKYNALVKANWYSYIRKATVTSDDIELDLVPLYSSLGVITPTELGIKTSTKMSSTDGMVSSANNELRSRMYSSTVTNEDINRIINHVYENKNGVFYDASEAKTSFTENTILGMLEEYGFDIPSAGGTKLFVSDSSKKYTHDEYRYNPYSAWDKYIANAKAYGTDCGKAIGFNNGSPAESIKWDTVTYYDYWYNDLNPSAKDTKNYVGSYSFYYFRAAPLVINSETDFRNFIADIASGNTYYQRQILLNADLDLSGIQYNKIWAAGNTSEFRGTFDGNHHVISGLNDSVTSGRTGLFRTLGDSARIQNLMLDNVNINGSSNTGALAGAVLGNAVINSVNVNSGKISGASYVGGLVGFVDYNSLVIKDCDNHASVTASGSYAGGIVGCSSSNKSQNISLCTNYGEISAKTNAAGIVAYLASDKQDQAHVITYCTNFGKISSSNGLAGGIVGHLDSDSQKHNVSNNRNEGSVTAPNGNAGGIAAYSEGGGKFTNNANLAEINGKTAGGIVANNEDDAIDFSGSENAGRVYAVSNAGGIAGYLGSNDDDMSYTAVKCKNSGSITSETANAGGIVGHLDTDGLKQTFTDCINTSDVNAVSGKAGGIVAYCEGGGSFSGDYNYGKITGQVAGGILAENEDDAIAFTSCGNSAVVLAESYAGGILGFTGSRNLDKAFSFDSCSNTGSVNSNSSYAGGIAGVISSDSTNHSFTDCRNEARISGKISTGGLMGKCEGGGTFKGCSNTGSIESVTTCAGGLVGYVVDDECSFDECLNIGLIKGVSSSGGIVGEAGSKDEDHSFTFTKCTNYGSVYSSGLNAGGMIGMLRTDSKKHSFDSDKNYGTVEGKTSAGGMIGFMYGGGTVKNCVNTKGVTALDAYAGGMIGRIEDDKCTFTDNVNNGVVNAPQYSGVICGYDGYSKKTI